MMTQRDVLMLILADLFFGIPGCGLLFYVYRCLKSGKVSGGSKFGGYGTDSRKENPVGYWGMIIVYSGFGIWFLYLAIFGTIANLKRHGIIH